MQRCTLAAVGDVGQQDQRPDEHEQNGRYRGHQGEGFHQIGNHPHQESAASRQMQENSRPREGTLRATGCRRTWAHRP
jgi:hypothetical protein